MAEIFAEDRLFPGDAIFRHEEGTYGLGDLTKPTITMMIGGAPVPIPTTQPMVGVCLKSFDKGSKIFDLDEDSGERIPVSGVCVNPDQIWRIQEDG